MQEFFTTYLEPILTFIAGGGIVGMIKWRSIKKQAEADAMKSVQEVYQEVIKDLREDKEMMKNENQDLRDKVTALQQIVFQNSKDIAELKMFKCTKLECNHRTRD